MKGLDTIKIMLKKESEKFLFKFLPIAGLSYFVYFVYSRGYFQYFHEFSVNEGNFYLFSEKNIARIIAPLIKYRHIESLYPNFHRKTQSVLEIYQNLIKAIDLNLSPEVSVVRSDLLFLNILPNGHLIISDVYSIF